MIAAHSVPHAPRAQRPPDTVPACHTTTLPCHPSASCPGEPLTAAHPAAPPAGQPGTEAPGVRRPPGLRTLEPLWCVRAACLPAAMSGPPAPNALLAAEGAPLTDCLRVSSPAVVSVRRLGFGRLLTVCSPLREQSQSQPGARLFCVNGGRCASWRVLCPHLPAPSPPSGTGCGGRGAVRWPGATLPCGLTGACPLPSPLRRLHPRLCQALTGRTRLPTARLPGTADRSSCPGLPVEGAAVSGL